MKSFKKIKVNFKMPPESPAERLAREHAARRKASGLPDPSHYKQMAAQKQKEIDAMKNEEVEELDEISTQLKTSYRQKAIADIRALRPHTQKGEYKDLAKNVMQKRQAGVNRSVKEEQEQIDEILGFGDHSKVDVTHYVKVNNAAKTTPSGKHVMKFPNRESAEKHAAEHKKKNPNHDVKVTTKIDDAPTWHGGTKTRPYSYGMREELEHLEEMPESSMKVRDVHAHLKKSGWSLARSSGGHDIYKHPQAKHHIPVPRHKQLKAPLIRGIMKASKVTEEAEIEEQLEKKGRFVSGQIKMPYKSNTLVTSVKEEKDKKEYGYEGDMALNQLATLTRCAEMIKDLLKPDTDMPEWVQSKITLATDYIQTAADYMHSEMKEEVELDEAIKIGSKVTIHSPGKDYHGQTGHVGEIRNGAHKDAPKTYTVDYGNSQSVQLKSTNMKKHKLDEIAVVKTNKEIGTRVADIGPGGKEYNVKTNSAWDKVKKKLPQGAEFAAQRRKERLAASGRMDEEIKAGDKVSFDHPMTAIPGKTMKKIGTVHKVEGDTAHLKSSTKYGTLSYKKHVSELRKEDVELDEGRQSQRHPLEGHEYHKKSNDALVHIAKDAHAAAEAMKGHNTTAENKYRDQANDSATVRYYRQKHGMQDWYKKKYGHVNEAADWRDEKHFGKGVVTNRPMSPQEKAEHEKSLEKDRRIAEIMKKHSDEYDRQQKSKRNQNLSTMKNASVKEANEPTTEVPSQDPLMDKGKPMSRKAQIVKSIAKGTKDKFFDKPELSGTIQKN
jgi:predicted RNA binding protein YcfA (HicA-like mRNA interferase family)